MSCCVERDTGRQLKIVKNCQQNIPSGMTVTFEACCSVDLKICCTFSDISSNREMC